MRFFREKLTYLPAIFVGSLLLSAGAHVDDAEVELVGNRITVKTEILLYGPGATRAVADRIQSTIDRAWDFRADGSPWTYLDRTANQTYTVTFDTRVSLLDGEERQEPNFIWDTWNPTSRKNYIKIVDTNVRSSVHGGDEGTWESDDPCWAHEFGHLVGMDDHYTDKEDANGQTYSVTNPGWETNIMGSSTGVVEQRNIDPIAKRIVEHRKAKRTAHWPQKGDPNVFHDEIDVDNPSD